MRKTSTLQLINEGKPMNLQARSALSMPPLSLAFSIALKAPLAATAADQPMDMHRHSATHEGGPLPLANQVRNVNVALDDGWVQATPCISSPNEGAMGIHFIKPDRVHDGVLKSDEPEMLICEPLPGGKFRLLGVEYPVIASEFAARNHRAPRRRSTATSRTSSASRIATRCRRSMRCTCGPGRTTRTATSPTSIRA